jgi:hypothetical protein
MESSGPLSIVRYIVVQWRAMASLEKDRDFSIIKKELVAKTKPGGILPPGFIF